MKMKMKTEILYNLNEKIANYEKWRVESIQRDYDNHPAKGVHDDAMYDRWIQSAKEDSQVGLEYQENMDVPCIGHRVYIITEIKDNGDVMGHCTFNNARELTEADVI